MSKDFNYYLSLDYDINIKPIAVEDSGGWLATIPLLEGCMSDGNTPDEAFKNVMDAKKDWVEFCLEEGISILEPSLSAQEKVSLNNLVNEYITSGLTEQIVANNYLKTIKEVITLNSHAYVDTKQSYPVSKEYKSGSFFKKHKTTIAKLKYTNHLIVEKSIYL